MTRMRLFVALVLALTMLATGTPALAAKDYRAERYDVTLALQADGSMRVTETIRFGFGPDSFTSVFREIPTRRTDGIQVLAVSIDGLPLVPGKRAGEYEAKRADNGRRRIVWHFEPTTQTTRTFEVTYLVRGIAAQGSSSDVVRWPALPDKHEYAIGCACLTLFYPPSAVLLDTPSLSPAPTRTPAEASALTYELCPVERDDSWLITASFAPRTLAAIAPGWQQRGERHAAYLPAFLGIAGLILAGGVLGFVVFAINHRSDVRRDPSSRLAERPEELPAGFAIALARSGQVTGPVALAALMDLAARGAVHLEEIESRSSFTKRAFRIVQADGSLASTAHERELLDLLFVSKSGPRSPVMLSELGKILQSPGRWRRFTNAVHSDLRDAGLTDLSREHTRSAVNRVSLGIVLMAIVGFVATIPFVNQVGPGALAVPGVTLLVAIAGFIVAGTLPVLTDEGLRRAGLWAGHGRHLKDQSKSTGRAPGAEAFGRILPYAAGFGVAVAWAKALEKHGVKTGAPWLHARAGHGEGGGEMAATIAMLSAGHAASVQTRGGHAAGTVGAGAWGGGSSGSPFYT
ncbi:MAG: DUF2207 domain-containing protein [Acidobacteriota bacterium]